MNLKATANTLLLFGIAIAIGGFIWAQSSNSEGGRCRRAGDFDCATGTNGWIVAAVGVGVTLIAIALLRGANTKPPPN